MRRRAALVVAVAATWLCFAASARAGIDGQCPAIHDKPDAIAHVDYEGVQRITYCYGPVAIKPGQNLIRFNPTDLYPQVPGYITRFDPEFIYADGTVPPVDVVHLHHAVWLVNGNPQFASGEEKSIIQLPQGFGWRSLPSDSWYLNDMLHDLTGNPASVYVVWRIDFVPDSSPAAASIHTVHTRWMDVSGISPYPVFDALRRFGNGKRYTFPDQATGAQVSRKGPARSWVPGHPVTLISTVGHLHPGGIKTGLRVDRRRKSTAIFRSRAHYYEPAGAVSWDVAMGATRPSWRVKLRARDRLSVHTTYDTSRADWYEVMGIMPVAVYDGTDVGGVDPFSKRLPKKALLTHGHLAENDHHGGGPTGLPDPRRLPNGPRAFGPVSIDNFAYSQGRPALGRGGGEPADDPRRPPAQLLQPRRQLRRVRPTTRSPPARRPVTAAPASPTRSPTARSPSTPASSATTTRASAPRPPATRAGARPRTSPRAPTPTSAASTRSCAAPSG